MVRIAGCGINGIACLISAYTRNSHEMTRLSGLPAIPVRRSLWACSGLLLFLAGVVAPAFAADEVQLGRRIYLDGVLPSGALLTGERAGASVSGAQAACAGCHRRSGMGSVEGTLIIPPVTGKFLFGDDQKNLATMDQRRRKSFNQRHAPYTDEQLAQAIRGGVNNRGSELSVVMPRFNLSDAETGALTAYLKQLSVEWSPGVTNERIRFATVIAPGVEPRRRKALLDTLRTAFTRKNASTVTGTSSGGRRHMVSAAEMVLGTEREWELDVWELHGPADTWGPQLAEHYRQQPVFALISGLSNTTWEPVHDFCQRERVPCWFPSIPQPVTTEAVYTVYFSRGAALEADVLARYLLGAGKPAPPRLIQIFRDDVPGGKAAQELASALDDSGIQVVGRALRGKAENALRAALSDVRNTDVLMFWLRAPDVAALRRLEPVPAAAVYFSGGLAGGETAPFPATWKNRARMVYPYELPDRRQASLAYFHAWLKLNKLDFVDEPLQSEAYFAVAFLSDTLAEMLDNLYRDYLLERAENMLSQSEGGKAEQESRMRVSLGRPGDLARRYPNRKQLAETQGLVGLDSGAKNKANGATIYPHLSLGPSQRFASKGGYIVRFAGGKLIAESDWIVP